VTAALPKISLVTPNYNYSHFLPATLKSVLDQGYPNLEYIVLDDGSTDDSMQILEPFRSRLARCETGPNQGQYRTITRGLLDCTGEIMGWLNSDDMHFPWTLRAIGEIFRDFPEVEWVSSLHLAHWDYHGFCLGVYPNRGFSREAFLDGRYLPEEARMESIPPPAAREFIQQESMFWRRGLWERAGSYISGDFGSAGDFELCARFYRYAELVGVNIPLSGFRHQSGQQTRQMERYAELCVPPLKQYREEMHWQPNRMRLLAHESARLGEFGRLVGAALRPIGYSGKRIVRRDANTKDAHWELEPHRFL
jgi:glycosyltransferase involved in cell wall biosynthesis